MERVSRFAVRTSWPRGSRGKNGATEFLSKTAFHTTVIVITQHTLRPAIEFTL